MADDLRREVMERLRDAETRRRIADALVAEATGGPPDPKSGVPKGGATVIRAFELIRDMARESVPAPDAAESDFSRYTDAELNAMLISLESGAASASPESGAASASLESGAASASLESGAAATTPGAADAPGDWASGIPPPDAGSRYA